MVFSKFLLDMELNETTKLLYMVLLDRARLSLKNEGWTDTSGHVFLYFAIDAMAEVLHKKLNLQKDKTSILNPIQHIKLNQQLTTVTEEIEELKSRKEQLIFQAECSSDKDMTNLSKKYDQMNKNLDILDSQDTTLKAKLKKDVATFREESFLPEPGQYLELLDTRIQIRPDFRDNLIAQLKATFGKYYDSHRRDIAAEVENTRF